jgi:hypothetical protein
MDITNINKEISKRAFPIITERDNYTEYINKFPDTDVRLILKVISLTGVRFSEALNSFIVYDNATNTHRLRCYALKRSKDTQFKLGHTKAVKIDDLQRDLEVYPNRFKSVPLLNILNLDIYELLDKSNDIQTPPNQMRPFSSYLTKKYYIAYYRALKKKGECRFRVNYMNSKLDNIEKEISITPTFHFYRKLFVSELYNKTKDIDYTIDVLKWTNINRMVDYTKSYDNLTKKLQGFEV